MKRYAYLPLIALAAIAVALLPATASARHGHHHRHQSGRKQAGDSRNSNGAIGHVASFDGTALVITLNNGDQMSGKVDRKTDIECRNNEAGDNEANEAGENEGNEPGENQMHGVRAADHGGTSGDNSGANEGDEQRNNGEHNCSSTLTQGTAVDRAILEGTATGAAFDRVDLQS